MSNDIRQLRADVNDHGEVHALIEEGEEIEVRKGTTEFDFSNGILKIEGADTKHRLPFDSIIRWYLPKDFVHEQH